MSAETPAAGTTQPAEAYRDGDALLVRRGADLSHTCIRCAKPAAGEPVMRRFGSGETWDPNMRGGGGGGAIGELIFALLMLLSFTSAVAEEKKAMNRLAFKFGLCAAHRRRRKIILLLALAAFGAGFVVFFLGLHAYRASQNYYGHQITVFPEMAMIASPLIAFVLPLCFAPLISRLRLVSAAQDWLGITGASPEFLQTLPALPKST